VTVVLASCLGALKGRPYNTDEVRCARGLVVAQSDERIDGEGAPSGDVAG
jgi:hypothetical protein